MSHSSEKLRQVSRAFLMSPRLPIDNNPQERLLRNPVIGRKTWYGTHSKLGAETAAILFSLVESPGGHLNFPHSWPGQTPPVRQDSLVILN